MTPQHVVIRRDGRIQYVGHLADAQLDAALRAARSPVAAGAGAHGAGSGRRAAPAAAATAPVRAVAVGEPVPATTVRTLDGRTVALRDTGAGVPTVFVFLSPWCESYLETTRPAMSASCRRAREQVDALAAARRVRWLGIASGLWADRDDLHEYQAEHHVGIPLALDESGELFRAFHVNDVPAVFIADAHGVLVRQVDMGAADGLRTALDAL